jgi:hypothetical protein
MAESRRKTAEKDPWLEGAKADKLEYMIWRFVSDHHPELGLL